MDEPKLYNSGFTTFTWMWWGLGVIILLSLVLPMIGAHGSKAMAGVYVIFLVGPFIVGFTFIIWLIAYSIRRSSYTNELKKWENSPKNMGTETQPKLKTLSEEEAKLKISKHKLWNGGFKVFTFFLSALLILEFINGALEFLIVLGIVALIWIIGYLVAKAVYERKIEKIEELIEKASPTQEGA